MGILLVIWQKRLKRPATVLTATDRMNNFDHITVLKPIVCIAAARHNFPVNFHRNAATTDTHQFNKLCSRAGFFYCLAVAIHCNIHAAKVNATGVVRSMTA